VAGRKLGCEQGVAEPQRAAVNRHDGGASAGPVSEHDGHAVADPRVRGLGAPAPEGDRVAAQRHQ
jgi:hypothetical protein